MKKTTKLVSLCAMAVLPLGVVIAGDTPGNTQAPTEVKAEEAETKTINLKIEGMRWGKSCVKKVRSALVGVTGVSKAQVSMPDKAVVTAGKDVKTEDLIKAVKAAGFTATVSS